MGYPYPHTSLPQGYGFLKGYKNSTRTHTHHTHDKNPYGLPIPTLITSHDGPWELIESLDEGGKTSVWRVIEC